MTYWPHISFIVDREDAVDGWGSTRAVRVGSVWSAGAASVIPVRRYGEPLPHIRHSYITCEFTINTSSAEIDFRRQSLKSIPTLKE